MSHVTAVKATLNLLALSGILLFLIFCIAKLSIPATQSPQICMHFCSIFVQQPSALPHPLLFSATHSQHVAPSLGKQSMSVCRLWGNSSFLSLQLLLSPCPRVNCRFKLAMLVVAKLHRQNFEAMHFPPSIYRRMNTLPRNSALDPSLCHASHFLVGYKVSEIPAVAPHWKEQLLHY